MGIGLRKHLQKVRFSGWDKIPFPQWPVDRTVDTLMESAMTLVLKAQGQSRIPFIWFWPDGASACGMMTHDVEGQAGLDFCDELMNIDDSYAIKSAFQLIPEGREQAWRRTAARLRQRGFEVNLHDLNHDGQLFANKEEFLHRAKRINQYAREFGCDGFRSAIMYREQAWFGAFEFSYDMSVPNAAHLEPQRGGCCTVMPYFVGDILELPLTTAQDYTLFHILNDYSTTLWKEQIRLISQHHGLISVITHPDYLVGRREREVYVDLLRHLADLREREGLWIALPGEINRWWRNRRQMTLVPVGDGWRIDGPDSHRARVAYATLEDDRIVYKVEALTSARERSAGAARVNRVVGTFLSRIAHVCPGGSSVRPRLQRWRGVQVGANAWIGLFVHIDELHPEGLSIGDNCTIGLRTSIITHFYWGPRRPVSNGKVVIENNVFIGPHCVILPNVRIGEGSVIQAGSVVSQSVPGAHALGRSGRRSTG